MEREFPNEWKYNSPRASPSLGSVCVQDDKFFGLAAAIFSSGGRISEYAIAATHATHTRGCRRGRNRRSKPERGREKHPDRYRPASRGREDTFPLEPLRNRAELWTLWFLRRSCAHSPVAAGPRLRLNIGPSFVALRRSNFAAGTRGMKLPSQQGWLEIP